MKAATLFFWLNRIAGAIVLIAIGLHLWLMHYEKPGVELRFENVISRFNNPFYFFLEGLFLIAVLYKALYGLRSVLYDFSSLHRIMKYITVLLVIIGIVFAFLGIDTLIRVVQSSKL